MRVVLLEASNPCIVLVAIKTSLGKVSNLEKYWPRCEHDKLVRWIKDAINYPSVLEHVKLSWLVDGISRVTSHQLVRHRIASYTQESQRYTEERIKKAIECILSMLKVRCKDFWECASNIEVNKDSKDYNTCLNIAFTIENIENTSYLIMALREYARCRTRNEKEVCRYLLPQASKTSILVTMNLREFLHFYCLRKSPKAQAEIRKLAERMMEEVAKKYPWLPRIAENFCKKWGYWA